nr:hypothetical protein [Candidatus Igneacidithiobacillus taiwanensis]
MVDGVFFANISGHVVRHQIKLPRFVPKAVAFYPVCGGENVRMAVAGVALIAGCVYRHVCGDAVGVGDVLGELKRKRRAFVF